MRALPLLVLVALATGCSAVGTDDEEATRFMRDEEKLARDVYRELARTYPDTATFATIAVSEDRHMAALLAVLEDAGLEDSTPAEEAQFEEPAHQALYTALVDRGSTSLEAALGVGLEIEELDLADLAERRAATTDLALARVLDNLADGSRRHLVAFHGALTALGGTYTAQHLSQAEFDAALADATTNGARGR